MNKFESLLKLREKLNRAEPSVGSWMQLPSSEIGEILGSAGYEWVAVDLEHGQFSPHQLPEIFRSLELNYTLPFARLKDSSPASCKQALDAGAAGVIVPMIQSAEQLRKAIDSCHWPPAGKRGVGFSRANLYGKNFSSYQSEAQAAFVVAMIETKEALEELHKIVAVDGLDAILLGPYDLSASLGVTAEFDNPEFLSTLSSIIEIVKLSRKPLGIHIVEPIPNLLHQRINEGYTFLPYSIDAVFFGRSSVNPLISP